MAGALPQYEAFVDRDKGPFVATHLVQRPAVRRPHPKPSGIAQARLAARRASVGAALWRILWAPFWAGSDLRSPALPGTANGDSRLIHLRRGLEATRFVQWMLEIQDRVWRQRLVLIALRTFWLVCLVGIAVVVRSILTAKFPPLPLLIVPAVVIVMLGFVYAYLQRPTRMGLARFLDQGYALDANLATSLELAQGDLDSQLAPQILNQAARTAYRIGRTNRLRLHRLDREQVLSLGLLIVLAGTILLMFVAPFKDNHPFIPVPKPPEAKATAPQKGSDPVSQPSLADQQLTPEQLQQLAVQSAQAQQDLNSLANALNDNSATKQAAQDLQQGDYNQAAQDLQQVASSVSQLSPDAKKQLANDLQQAAMQNNTSNNDLSRAEQNAASALQQPGNDTQQAQSLRDLSNQVQQTGGQVKSQQDIANALQQANQSGAGDKPGDSQQGGKPQNGTGQNGDQNGPGAGLGQPVPYQATDGPPPNLGTNGRPVTLTGQSDGQGNPLPGGQGNPQQSNNNMPANPSAPVSAQQGSVGQSTVDSNHVPARVRDSVKGYFNPPAGK